MPDGKGLGVEAGGLFQSLVVGPPVSELIRQKALLKPIVYTSRQMFDISELRRDRSGDYTQKSLTDHTDKPVITGSAVEQYQRVCPGRRAIVFCTCIRHAQHVVEQFNAAGYRFALLVGQPAMSDAERTSVNRQLRIGQLDGVCTVDLVSEGYDLPGLECCIMLRPTASLGLYLQQVGRIMRPAPGKETCWLLDHVGNVGSQVDGKFIPKHGLPCEDREWDLDGESRTTASRQDDDAYEPVRQCPECFSTHEIADVCPACGHIYKKRNRQITQVEGDLHEVTPEMITDLQRFQRRREQADCKTLEELQAYGALTGKHPNWSVHVWNARQRKAEARNRTDFGGGSRSDQSHTYSRENQCL